MKRTIALLLSAALVLALCGCMSSKPATQPTVTTTAPTTTQPVTTAPTTVPETTVPDTTVPATTAAPETTAAPTTQPATTVPPTTVPPTTAAPTTVPPVTQPPAVQTPQFTPPAEGYALGSDVSDMVVTDLDGSSRTIAQILEEKDMVMLNFWFSTCYYCVEEFPYIEAAYQGYSESVAILALNPVGETADTVRAFWQQMGLTFTPGIDVRGVLADAFGVRGYPTTVFIDRDGIVCMIQVGGIPYQWVFEEAFSRFTAADYERKLYDGINDMLNS